MSGINLDECKEITGSECVKLKDAQFKGQTRVVDNWYWMVWESEGVMYKTHNQLIDYARREKAWAERLAREKGEKNQ